MPVSRYLHTLSAALFYLVGSSCFVAYVLLRNGMGGEAPGLWLNVIDLPLLALGLLYGGLSIYRSLSDGHPSRTLAWGVGIPFTVLFVLAALANFWPALSPAA